MHTLKPLLIGSALLSLTNSEVPYDIMIADSNQGLL